MLFCDGGYFSDHALTLVAQNLTPRIWNMLCIFALKYLFLMLQYLKPSNFSGRQAHD